MRWSGCPGLKTIFHQALEEGLLMVRGFGPVVESQNCVVYCPEFLKHFGWVLGLCMLYSMQALPVTPCKCS